MNPMTRLMVIAGCTCAFLTADTAPRGPVLSYFFDPAVALMRPVLGVAGSAVVADPVTFTGALRMAAVSHSQDYALAVVQGSGNVVLAIFSDSTLSSVPAPPSPDRIDLSPSSGSAALYYAGANEMVLITGLPANPATTVDFVLPHAGMLTAAAVSDDGRSAIAAFDDGVQPSIFRIDDGAVFAPVLSGHIAAARYDARARSAIVADRTNDAVLLLSPGSSAPVSIAGAGEGVNHPLSVWRDAAAGSLYIANSDGSLIAVSFGDSGQTGRLVASCGCAPETLEPIGADLLFRLSNAPNRRQLLFDASAGRILFVPQPPSARQPDKLHAHQTATLGDN